MPDDCSESFDRCTLDSHAWESGRPVARAPPIELLLPPKAADDVAPDRGGVRAAVLLVVVVRVAEPARHRDGVCVCVC